MKRCTVCRFGEECLSSLVDVANTTSAEDVRALSRAMKVCEKCQPAFIHSLALAFYTLGNCADALETYESVPTESLGPFALLNRHALSLSVRGLSEMDACNRFEDDALRDASLRNLSIARDFVGPAQSLQESFRRSHRLTMAVPEDPVGERITNGPVELETPEWHLRLCISSRRGALWELLRAPPVFPPVSDADARADPGLWRPPIVTAAGRSFLQGLSCGAVIQQTSPFALEDRGRRVLLETGTGACSPAPTPTPLFEFALREYLSRRPKTRVEVHREFAVTDFALHWAKSTADTVADLLEVVYVGESAIDGGPSRGLTADLFETFFVQVSDDWLHGNPRKFGELVDRAFGCCLAKCVVEGRAVNLELLPEAYWDVILGGPMLSAVLSPTEALCRYDVALSHTLRRSMADPLILSALEEPDGSPVTPDSSSLFATSTAARTCVRIEIFLRPACEGYKAILSGLPDELREPLTLNVARARVKPAPATAPDIIKRLEFKGWESSASTPYYLCCWLHSASRDQLSAFLQLCTGSRVLPTDHRRICVEHHEDKFSSKTCFWQLFMPAFPSAGAAAEAMCAALTVANCSMSDE
jgi:hypothetical protein